MLKSCKFNISLVSAKIIKMFRVVDVSYSYPDSKNFALKNVGFEIKKGDYCVVLGTNGSGKSTLARIMAGFLQPSSGKVELDENLLTGIVFQSPKEQVVSEIVSRDTAFGPENLGVEKAEVEQRVIESLSATDLLDKAMSSTNALSLGQTQKLAVSGILALHPELLILDEATSMLDPDSRKELLDFIDSSHRRGQTIVHITHDFNEALKATHVIVIEKGNLVALLGPSGSGKTTLLRMIAGLETPNSGDIYIDGQRVNDVPAARRGIGFVFQNYALFRYMTVYDNVAFGLELMKMPKKEIKKRVTELLELTGLSGMEKRYPNQLSGGQRQRVAFARALAPNPQVLLLDEPFAAIDAKVRTELRTWLKEMVTKLGITSIFVTHDQDEAVEVADEIIITNHGRIEQLGTPMEIYKSPDTPFVAQFIGRSSVVEHYDKLKGFDPVEGAHHAVLRPEFVKLSRSEPERYISATETGIVKDIVFRGNHLDIVVDIDGIEIVAERSLEKDALSIGEKVYVLIYRLYIFDEHQTYLVENQEMQVDDVFYI